MWRKCTDIAFWLGISLYFGGLLTLGAIVAPAIFQTTRITQISMPGIAAPPLDMPNQVGGELFGVVLNRFSIVEAVSLALMFVGIAGWILGTRHIRRSTLIVITLWVVLGLLAAIDAASIRPKVWTLRETIRQQAAGHATDAPNASWPEREEFDRLHHWDERIGSSKVYLLFAMILITAWRGNAERRSRPGDRNRILAKTTRLHQ